MRQHAELAAECSAPECRTASAAPVAGIAAETVLTVHGKIVSVDQASKQVTLEGPNGKDITLTVNNPYNLQSLESWRPLRGEIYGKYNDCCQGTER